MRPVLTLRHTAVFALGAAVLMCSCSPSASQRSAGAEAALPTQSGFLQDYNGLRRSPDEAGRWYSLSRRLGSYSAFLVEKPVMLASTTSRGAPIDPVMADELCAALRDELTRSLSGQYRLTETPGPGVARIRTAITEVSRSVAAAGGSVQAGGGAREMEIVDSVSGERLAAVVEKDFERDEHISAPAAPYHDARVTFKHWSSRLMLMLRDTERLATVE